MPVKSFPAVYAFIHKTSGRRYVGSTNNFKLRWMNHRARLRGNKHWIRELQEDWDADPSQFDFIELERCQVDKLKDREQYWLDLYKANGQPLYNVLPNTKDWTGAKHSIETREKISKIQIGHKMPEWLKEKIAASNRGPQSEERKAYKRGTTNPNAKLTIEQLSNVRYLLASGFPVRDIANMFNVTYQCIWAIKKGHAHNL